MASRPKTSFVRSSSKKPLTSVLTEPPPPCIVLETTPSPSLPSPSPSLPMDPGLDSSSTVDLSQSFVSGSNFAAFHGSSSSSIGDFDKVVSFDPQTNTSVVKKSVVKPQSKRQGYGRHRSHHYDTPSKKLDSWSRCKKKFKTLPLRGADYSSDSSMDKSGSYSSSSDLEESQPLEDDADDSALLKDNTPLSTDNGVDGLLPSRSLVVDHLQGSDVSDLESCLFSSSSSSDGEDYYYLKYKSLKVDMEKILSDFEAYASNSSALDERLGKLIDDRIDVYISNNIQAQFSPITKDWLLLNGRKYLQADTYQWLNTRSTLERRIQSGKVVQHLLPVTSLELSKDSGIEFKGDDSAVKSVLSHSTGPLVPVVVDSKSKSKILKPLDKPSKSSAYPSYNNKRRHSDSSGDDNDDSRHSRSRSNHSSSESDSNDRFKPKSRGRPKGKSVPVKKKRRIAK